MVIAEHFEASRNEEGGAHSAFLRVQVLAGRSPPRMFRALGERWGGIFGACVIVEMLELSRGGLRRSSA